MNLPITSSFMLYTGATDYINYQCTDDTNTVPVDITGYTFYFTAKTNPSYPDSSASIALTETTFSNATFGQVSIPLSSSVTANLLPGKYYYDLVSVDPSGNITPWENGAFLLGRSIKQSFK